MPRLRFGSIICLMGLACVSTAVQPANLLAQAAFATPTVFPGDSLRWKEVGSDRRYGRLLFMMPEGMRIANHRDSVTLRYSNLEQLDRWKKRSARASILVGALMIGGMAVGYAIAPDRYSQCNEFGQCVQIEDYSRTAGKSPLKWGVIGAGAGAALGGLYVAIRPGSWRPTIVR